MGSYLVRKLKVKSRDWKVQFQVYKEGKPSVTDIALRDYQRLGLSSRMTHEEVKARCAQLNAQSRLKNLQEKRNSINSRLKEEDLKLNAFLPTTILDEFERRIAIHTDKKQRSYWRAAKRVMTELSIEPVDWAFSKLDFYRAFIRRSWSYSYVEKVVGILNQWGKFVSYRQKTYFDPLPLPTDNEKQKIIDHHEEEKGFFKSGPLHPKELEAIKGNLKPEQYNWLYLSVWLGLRPIEVDILKKEEGLKTTYYVEKQESIDILWVYQTKLTGVSKPDRLKPIPLKYPEQLGILELIRGQNFHRPLVKTMNRYCKEYVNLYAGRKGFTDLMLEKGNSLEAISQWLGHRSIQRTWQNYKNKKKVLL